LKGENEIKIKNYYELLIQIVKYLGLGWKYRQRGENHGYFAKVVGGYFIYQNNCFI
jgi:hypothetical protein